MSQNTRLLLIALGVMVVFGIFLQSLIARSLQDSFGQQNSLPTLPAAVPTTPVPGIAPMPVPMPTPNPAAHAQKPAAPAASKKPKGK